jgi:ATP-dependent Clp protease, protease subunit
MKPKNDKEHGHEHGPLVAPLVRGYASSYIEMAKSRAIFMHEDVSDQVAAELSAMLLYYDNEDHEEPISLYLHSNGGAVSGLANIYDVMQMVHAPVKTYLLGKCYSAGAVILAAGSKGERYALKSSNVMIHGIQFAFPIPGEDMANNKSYLDFVNEENDRIMKMLAHHTGQPLDKIKQDCTREVWLDAKAAKEYGIIDHII